MSRERRRCAWCLGSPEYVAYHDREWGVPVLDDRTLFEFLVLEGAQAGLAWATILKKREAYREAFAGFDPAKVARFSGRDRTRLMKNAGIVRNRLKIDSAIENARRFREVQEEHGSFARYLWAFVDGTPVQGKRRSAKGVPARTALSDRVSRDLRRRGFRFVGSTIVYAYLQAVGVVNDHVLGCFRHAPLARRARVRLPAARRAAKGRRPRGTASSAGPRPARPGRAKTPPPGDVVLDVSASSGAGPTPGLGYFSRFGVSERTIRQALEEALSSGGDYSDVFFQHRVTNSYALEDGSVNRAYKSVELGAGVRVVRGDQTGYGFTEDLTGAGLRLAARTAAAIAEGPSRPAPRRFHAPPPAPSRYPVRLRWEEVSSERKLPLLSDLNRRTFDADGRVRKVTISFSDQASAILVADSLGRVVEDVQPMTLLYLSCVAEQDGRREQNMYGVAGRADIGFYTPERLKRVVDEAVARTTILFEAVQPPAGEMPVVLAAGSSGILLHEAIGHGMEADFNRKGTSIYADKIGRPVAHPFVTIVDDGTQTGARGAINVDDEGNAAGRTVLVQDGVLATYLHDTISARHYGVQPTGSGRRESYQYPPMPRMRSTYMLGGPHARDEIVASVKRGIYCSNFSNGQVQIGAGDFTFYVKNGYLIEDGRLTRPIKDVNIIGNGPKVLEQIDMVADDLAIDEGGWTCGKDGQSVPVSQGIPTVRVAALTVGGRG